MKDTKESQDYLFPCYVLFVPPPAIGDIVFIFPVFLCEPWRSFAAFAFMLLTFLTTHEAVNGNIKFFSLPRVSSYSFPLATQHSTLNSQLS
jgi:hypothetical protein